MPGSFLLDTKIAVALLAGEDAVRAALRQTGLIFLFSVVLGKLFYGARKSARREANLARIEAFAAKFAALSCDLSTARCYGNIRDFLRARGKPIPENDIWIAAHAQQYDLTLVTRDAQFAAVEGIRVQAW